MGATSAETPQPPAERDCPDHFGIGERLGEPAPADAAKSPNRQLLLELRSTYPGR